MQTVASEYTEHKLWSLPGGAHYMTLSNDMKSWFNPAGGQFYLYDGVMEVVVFNTANGAEIMALAGKPLLGSYTAFSPDGTLIALHENEIFIMYDTTDGEMIAEFVLDSLPKTAVFTNDLAKLVVGDEAGKVIVFDLAEGSQLASWQAMDVAINSLYLAEEESVLVVVGQESPAFSYWSFPQGTLIRRLQRADEVVYFAVLHPSGKVVSSYSNFNYNFWSLPGGQLLASYYEETVIGYSPDSDYIVTGEPEEESYSLVLLEANEVVTSYPATPDRTNTYIWLSPDNRYFAEMEDVTILIRSLADGEVLFRLEGHTCEIASLTFTEDNAYVISGDTCGGVNIWSLEDGSFQGCAIDLTLVSSHVDLNQYDVTLPGGGTVTYTLPCGAPIPAGAVCTCNCVAGGGCSCVGHSSGGGSHYWYPN